MYPRPLYTGNGNGNGNGGSSNNNNNGNDNGGIVDNVSKLGSLSPLDSKSAVVDDDNMPCDSETLGLIEQVVDQYVESVEMVQAKRNNGKVRKRESDYGAGMSLLLTSANSTSPTSAAAVAASVNNINFSQTPPNHLQNALYLTNGSSSSFASRHSTSLGIADIIDNTANAAHHKRRRLDEEQPPHHHHHHHHHQYHPSNSNTNSTMNLQSYTPRDPLPTTPSDTSDDGHKTDDNINNTYNTVNQSTKSIPENLQLPKRKSSNSLNDILIHPSAAIASIEAHNARAFHDHHTIPSARGSSSTRDSTTSSTSSILNQHNQHALFLTNSVADAASSAVLRKVPDILQALRENIEESDKAQIELIKSFGSSLGSAFGASLANTFASTVSSAVEQIVQRMEEVKNGHNSSSTKSPDTANS